MEKFLASPHGKCAILCLVLLLVLGFGYHLAYNLKRAGEAGPSPGEMGRPSSDTGSRKP